MPQANWKQFEMLVASVQRELSPGSTVTHNDKIVGRKSKVARQIDVSIRGTVGQFELLIIIDCKDHATPVDINDVGKFLELMDDVGAHQGAIVAAKGFTEGARNRAAEAGITLYGLVDTDPHKWHVKVAMPILCDLRSMTFSLRLSVSAPMPFEISRDEKDWIVRDAAGTVLGKPFDLVAKKWYAGDLPIDVGEHENVDFVGQQPHMDNGHGLTVPVSLTADLTVKRRLFFGRLPLKDIRGLAQDDGKGVITRGFTTTPLSLELIEKEFQEIPSEDSLPGKPGMAMQILHCYGPLS